MVAGVASSGGRSRRMALHIVVDGSGADAERVRHGPKRSGAAGRPPARRAGARGRRCLPSRDRSKEDGRRARARPARSSTPAPPWRCPSTPLGGRRHAETTDQVAVPAQRDVGPRASSPSSTDEPPRLGRQARGPYPSTSGVRRRSPARPARGPRRRSLHEHDLERDPRSAAVGQCDAPSSSATATAACSGGGRACELNGPTSTGSPRPRQHPQPRDGRVGGPSTKGSTVKLDAGTRATCHLLRAAVPGESDGTEAVGRRGRGPAGCGRPGRGRR